MLRFWPLLALALSCSAVADQRPKLSLVVDDLGYSLDRGIAAIELEGTHTYAILPDTSYSRLLAERAHQHGKEVILHLPMQSINSASSREPHALNEAMDEDELTAKVHHLLREVPFIRGVNNHMGSHLTEFDFFMRPVMDSIRGYNPNLYFLDSRTSPRSVALAEAREAGLRSISRDVFLDNETNPESIRLQIQIWLAQARQRGTAIAIGHPYDNTIRQLRENLPAALAEFEFLPISRMIEVRKLDSSKVPGAEILSGLETTRQQ